MADLQEEPRFCPKCGTKLKKQHAISYDTQTGKKIVSPTYKLCCPESMCIVEYRAVRYCGDTILWWREWPPEQRPEGL